MVSARAIGGFEHRHRTPTQELGATDAFGSCQLVEAPDELVVQLNQNLSPTHDHMLEHMALPSQWNRFSSHRMPRTQRVAMKIPGSLKWAAAPGFLLLFALLIARAVRRTAPE